MAMIRLPQEDVWYVSPRTGEYFCVLSCDASEASESPLETTLQLQYFNGDIDQMMLEEWLNIGALPCEPPQSMCGAYCVSESFDSPEEDFREPHEMSEILEKIEKGQRDGFSIH